MRIEYPDHAAMQFHGKRREAVVIDQLCGLAEGIVADGVVNESEAAYLEAWLARNHNFIGSSTVTTQLAAIVNTCLEDGRIDAIESEQLLDVLRAFSPTPVPDEPPAPTVLPYDYPLPRLTYPERRYLFTGTFTFGTRVECEKAAAEAGSMVVKAVTQKLDFLVVGSYATPSWKHGHWGNKIEKALTYRDVRGVPLAIVPEEHWLTHLPL